MTKLETLGQELQDEFGKVLSGGVEVRALFLASEVGELAKEVIKGAAYGARPFEATDAFKEELGDALVDLALLAQAADVTLAECLNVALAKMRERLARQGHVGSGR